MKKIYLFLFLISITLVSAAQNASLAFSMDSICLGESVTAKVIPPSYELTGASGVNSNNGIMFDITATNDAMITGFIINNLTATTTYEVYYRTGSHVGFENSATGWTLIGTAQNVPVGTDVDLGLSLDQPIVAGQTLAFYITTTNIIHYLEYGNGISVGNTINSNTWITIKEGVGKDYPFSTSFSPRTFIGKVKMEPAVNSIQWNTGATTDSITVQPVRPQVLGANLSLSGGLTEIVARAIPLKEINATATANPSQITPGGSSTLTSEVSLKTGVITTMNGGNWQNGAMFDVEATNPLSITGFTVNTYDTSTANIEILYKTGTFIGFEGNAGAWTSLGTFTVPAGAGRYLELNNPVVMVAGQTIAFYITRTDAGALYYTNGTSLGSVAAEVAGLKVKEGKGVAYPFGTLFSPRILNTIVHFEMENLSGVTYSWSGGGSSGSVTVSPTSTTTYTLTASKGGCSSTADVTVTVSGVGIEEEEMSGIKIYPNPATDNLIVEFPELVDNMNLQMVDVAGRTVYSEQIHGNHSHAQVPVSDLSSGIYFLTISHGTTIKTFKVKVN